MEIWDIISSVAVREVSATAVLVGVVVFILTGQLIPGRTHKRELDAANKVATEWRLASEKKDVVNQRLLDQNSALLAGVRIADKFYRDFVPSLDDATVPRGQVVSDVGQ